MIDPPGVALAVVAHPDDIEFGFGGTIALWIEAGWRVVYVIATRGDKGSSDPAITSETLAATRAEEQRAAAAFLGAAAVEFLGYDDGGLEPTLGLRRDIARQIRRHRPRRMVVTDPASLYESRYIQHPDHLATAQAALAATFAARDRLTFPELLAEGLAPHAVGEVWISDGQGADVWVDITPTMPRKLDALRCHASQISEEFLGFVEVRARESAATAPAPQPTYAERFRVITP